jgi:hypothetical protein
MIEQQVKKVSKLPNKILAREIRYFLLLSYCSVWICFPVMAEMDLKAATPYLSPLDEIYLAQLSFSVWFGIMIALYILRFLIYLLIQKFK